MILSLKKYVKTIIYRFNTKLLVDKDFYDCDFYLYEMESDFFV